jgi:hypothetical protein
MSKQSFYCKKCEYTCAIQSVFNKHLLTNKHILNTDNEFICMCGKEYQTQSGLRKHNKTCKYIRELNIPKDVANDDIKELLIKQTKNQEIIIEQNKNHEILLEKLNQKPQNVTNNTNNINNTTNKFNLNIYLNETCKDAINITDFISQLQLTMSDFENFATLGYVQNISNIFIRNLKLLDKTKRPILCSDSKREVIYIKDQNVWEKDENNQKTIKTIKKIARDNTKQSDNWLTANPKYYEYDSKENTKHSLIMNEAMGADTLEDDAKNYDKIVRNVIKEVTVCKSE